jgi:hypothetical protein
VNIALWIVSGLLAVTYIGAGAMKLVVPKKRLADNPNMAAIGEALSAGSIKTIGGIEIAGGLGVVLPWLTGIAAILTPAAAIGLALLQLGAIVFHGRRREYKQWPANLVLFALAVFVAWGRLAGLGG